jgi:hypothetical protein
MSQPLISGFMIVRNVAAQGYPFVEAIRSALPICDEFLVSDGGSTDDTGRALEILRDRHPKQIRLFRDPWPAGNSRDASLAGMTNVLRHRCTGRYIFNLQANEVLHESSTAAINDLIGQWPAAAMFRLPFHNLLGDRLVWMTDQRRRLAVNRPDIISLADAFDLGPDPSPVQRLRRFLKRESGAAHGAWISEPVYRYRVLFPTNYIRRLEETTNRSYLWNKELNYAKALYAQMNPAADDAAEFWRRMRDYFDRAMFEDLPEGVRVPSHIPRHCAGEISAAPAIARPLFGRWSYPLEESLARIQ